MIARFRPTSGACPIKWPSKRDSRQTAKWFRARFLRGIVVVHDPKRDHLPPTILCSKQLLTVFNDSEAPSRWIILDRKRNDSRSIVVKDFSSTDPIFPITVDKLERNDSFEPGAWRNRRSSPRGIRVEKPRSICKSTAISTSRLTSNRSFAFVFFYMSRVKFYPLKIYITRVSYYNLHTYFDFSNFIYRHLGRREPIRTLI